MKIEGKRNESVKNEFKIMRKNNQGANNETNSPC